MTTSVPVKTLCVGHALKRSNCKTYAASVQENHLEAFGRMEEEVKSVSLEDAGAGSLKLL